MNMLGKCILGALWITVMLDLIVAQSCTIEEQHACTKELDAYFVNSHTVYPNFNDATFTAVCSAADNAHGCLVRLEPWCTSIVQRHHEGVRNAYTYICGQGSIVYKESRDCFDKPELLQDASKCNNTYQEDLRELIAKAYYMDKDDMAEEQCRLTNIYLWCVRDEVKSHCGGVAAQWQHKVNSLVLTPVLDEINCVVEEPFPLNRIQILIIVISIIGGIVFIAMIVLTVVFCIQRKREKDRLLLEQEQMEHTENDEKPPLEFTNKAMTGSGTLTTDEKALKSAEKLDKVILASIPPSTKVAPVQNGNNPPAQGSQGSQGPKGPSQGPQQGPQKGKQKGKPYDKKSKHHKHKRGHPQANVPSQYPSQYPSPYPSQHPPQYLSVPDHRSSQYSAEGSLKSSLKSTERSNRSSRNVTLDESANRSLPEYDTVTQKY